MKEWEEKKCLIRRDDDSRIEMNSVQFLVATKKSIFLDE